MKLNFLQSPKRIFGALSRQWMLNTAKPLVITTACLAIVPLAMTPSLQASAPEANVLSLSGIQRGTSAEITISGARLGDANSFIFYSPGIKAENVTKIDDNSIKATITVAADVPPDLHPFRVITNTGISNMRLLNVSTMPTVAEVEPNSDFATPQIVPLNSTVEGVVLSEDVDYFAVELKEGQQLTVELEGLRHAYMTNFFDPYIAIYDDKRFEIAASDDSVFLQQDCLASIVAPKDGKYIIEVRESSFGGNDNCRYRLHVGDFPRPVAMVPSGGKPGEKIEVTCIDALGNQWKESFQLPENETENFKVWSTRDGAIAPSPNILRVVDAANELEAEPNDDHNAIETVHTLPAAFNGILEKQSDRDYFVFEAKKDQQLEVRVHARYPHRSQVDPVVQVWKVGGGALAGNDDSGGPDSYLQFKVPEDGKYAIAVYDHLGNFGPTFAYRAEVLFQNPQVEATIIEQERWVSQTVAVPKGGQFAIGVNVVRKFVGGETKIEVPDLPPGLTHLETICPPDLGKVTMLFEAAADAPNAGKLVDLHAKLQQSADKILEGQLTQRTQLIRGQNNVDVWGQTNNKLAVAVIDAAPFSLEVVEPQVPLVRNGSLGLRINIQRAEGFDKPVNLRILDVPPGVGAAAVTIPGDQSTIELGLTANGNAALRKWPLIVQATTDNGYGPIQLSSKFFNLEVAEPIFEFQFAKTVAEQGKPVDVVLGAKLKKPVEGKVEVEILGIPPGTVTATPKIELKPDMERISFPIEIPAETRAGNYKTIVYRGTITTDKGVITQVNGNSEIQIDVPIAPPAAPPAAEAAAATPSAPPPPADKPLSRLEQLKQQRAR